MITTLTGSNGFGLQAELNRLVTEFLKIHGDMGLERIDGEEAIYSRIREALESLPFLASKKMVVLRAPGANKDFVAGAEQLLRAVPDTTDVIVVEPKLDKRSGYYKFLKKDTQCIEFSQQDEQSLARWLVDIAKQHTATLQPADARYLIERVGVNQHMLANELSKLVAYNPHISRHTIDLLTEPNPHSTIFQLLDAAFAGDSRQAMQLYHEQRASKVEPQQIIALLAWQLHVVAVIKIAGERSDGNIATEAKINLYVVQKSRTIARKLTHARLKQLVTGLAELDIQLKTLAIDADDAMQHFLLTLSHV